MSDGISALRLSRRNFLAGSAALVAASGLSFPGFAADGQKIIASGLNFPEGPTVLPDGSLAICEIMGNRVTRLALDGTTSTIAEVPNGPAGSALGPDGKLYVCCIGGGPGAVDAGSVIVIDLDTGETKTLYEKYENHHLQGANDLVFDPYGDFWFTDMSDNRVYWARTDGSEIKLVAEDVTGANGIGLSPDRKTLYFVSGHSLSALAINGQGAWATTKFGTADVKELGIVDPDAGPDGFKVEADGNIVVACWQAGLVVMSPQGEKLEAVQVDGISPTNLVFGGSDKKTVYVTGNETGQGEGGVSGQVIELSWPRAGL